MLQIFLRAAFNQLSSVVLHRSYFKSLRSDLFTGDCSGYISAVCSIVVQTHSSYSVKHKN